MPNILQLSNTYLNGNPVRLSNLINKYSKNYRSRSIVWETPSFRKAGILDLIGESLPEKELLDKMQWADIIHIWGNPSESIPLIRYPQAYLKKRLLIQYLNPDCSTWNITLNNNPLPVAITPRNSLKECTAQYLVPDPLDIFDEEFVPHKKSPKKVKPLVKFINRGSVGILQKQLDRMTDNGIFMLLPNSDYPHDVLADFRKGADIAVDGAFNSYSVSLDYLATGIPCFCNLNTQIKENIMALTGATTIPWIPVNRDVFQALFLNMIYSKKWSKEGKKARVWMEKYLNPELIIKHYEDMYEDVLHGNLS